MPVAAERCGAGFRVARERVAVLAAVGEHQPDVLGAAARTCGEVDALGLVLARQQVGEVQLAVRWRLTFIWPVEALMVPSWLSVK